MYHKCVKCEKVYEHASEEILTGCICGSKLFYFVKTGSAKNNKNNECANTEMSQTPDIEYFYELEEGSEPIIFDLEAIRVTSSGKYELNLESLMSNNGLIYQYGEGKYSIDIDANMKKLKKR